MYIESPCKRECTQTFNGDVCKGCGRTDDEIESWMDMTDEEKLTVLRRLEDE